MFGLLCVLISSMRIVCSYIALFVLTSHYLFLYRIVCSYIAWFVLTSHCLFLCRIGALFVPISNRRLVFMNCLPRSHTHAYTCICSVRIHLHWRLAHCWKHVLTHTHTHKRTLIYIQGIRFILTDGLYSVLYTYTHILTHTHKRIHIHIYRAFASSSLTARA